MEPGNIINLQRSLNSFYTDFYEDLEFFYDN